MMLERLRRTTTADPLRIDIDQGHAEVMGDGMFIVFQTVDDETHSVVLSREDLARMIGVG